MSMPAEFLRTRPTLDQLLRGIADAPALEITGIASDSRELAHGHLFLACRGASSHGLDYLREALAAGAAAVAWDDATADPVEFDAPVPLIAVPGLGTKLGEIANRWFDAPSKALRVTGITGTNGKTTVASLLAQTLAHDETQCGYVGTLGAGIGELDDTQQMTTPACIELHRRLADFVDAGATHAAIEVSSHAIAQDRIDGVRFDAAIFTNLSRDHIDYHGNMREYGETKARLLIDYQPHHRIINVDSEFGQQLANRCRDNTVVVSTTLDRLANGRPHVFVRSVVAQDEGSRIAFVSSWGEGEIELPLPGEFNTANAVAVLALLLRWDVPLERACALLGQVQAPPGRMQRVNPAEDGALPSVYVDYAHTPAGLEAVLQALKVHCRGQLWCVFGCGGDRDRGKRPLMGRVVARLADRPVVTSDNPRTEAPDRIIGDVLEAMVPETVVFEDRAAAIAHAVGSAAADDIVLVAGKGHEDYQVIGEERLPFSDYACALAHLAARHRAGRQ